MNEMGRNIEKMLSNKKTNNQFSDNISTEDFLTQTSETSLSEDSTTAALDVRAPAMAC